MASRCYVHPASGAYPWRMEYRSGIRATPTGTSFAVIFRRYFLDKASADAAADRGNLKLENRKQLYRETTARPAAGGGDVR